MRTRRTTSAVILITLAELAWLAALSLLFAYRAKVSELTKVQGDLKNASQEVIVLRSNAQAADKMAVEVSSFTEQKSELERRQERLRVQLTETETQRAKFFTELQATSNKLSQIQRRWEGIPTNATELVDRLREYKERLKSADNQLSATSVRIGTLSNRVQQLEIGEVGIRRELTGLPERELHRVIFIVDTSSSMRSSPAWTAARNLMRTWVEYLSVEECVLVNFNDRAFTFPTNGYFRVREPGSTLVLTNNMATLLKQFDTASAGVYSDLQAGFKAAYAYPTPDLIVLFTDGHPHIATKMDSKYASDILKQVTKGPKVPILSVAIGSYEVEGEGGPREHANPAIAFLKRLAEVSGGGFIGR